MALAVLAPVGPAAPARATVGPEGARCGLVQADDPTREPGWRVGEIYGGPVAGDGRLTCTVQRNDGTHSGADAATVSASGRWAVVVPPATVNYLATSSDEVYICTRFTYVDGTTVYWDGVAGAWSGSPLVACTRADDDRGVQPAAPKRTPVYPRGIVRIYREIGGGVHTFADPATFDPPLALWSCARPALTEYACTPPAPGTRAYNVCRTVTLVVVLEGLGTVSGDSACAYGTAARATATATAPVATGGAAPATDFAWTCSVSEDLLATAGPWSVDCTVG